MIGLNSIAAVFVLNATRSPQPLLISPISQKVGPLRVEIKGKLGSYQLFRGGKPYVINGVGGTTRMNDLVQFGGNSMRTWGSEKATSELDQAQSKGISIMLGIWLGHKSYFDYKNPKQVAEQLEKCKKDILAYRNHPGLLIWGFGNEMEINNDIPETWKAIDEIAKFAKQNDPNHPTATVVAEINEQKIANIIKYAPNIDVLGINSYGGLNSLPERLRKAGWTKPYIVTEFGPLGPWERKKTEWNAAYEQTSTEKAEMYQKSYQNSIASQRGWCLGSYAFLWGDKQEETPTWFGMFLPSGERTGAVDVISQGWSGKRPRNLSPRLKSFEFNAPGKTVAKSASLIAKVSADDPDQDNLSYKWEILGESKDKRRDGQGEDKPKPVSGRWDQIKGAQLTVEAPSVAGTYRLFVKILDGRGGAAIANFPFRVQ
jgi:hypothetical protein